MALPGWHALQASIHGASMPCLLKIACTRGFQGGSRSGENAELKVYACIDWYALRRNQPRVMR